MQKGFGLIVFVVVISVLLLSVGAGFWLGRTSLLYSLSLESKDSTQPIEPLTKFSARSYDPQRELYPGYPVPTELTSIDDTRLVKFNCDGPYIRNGDGQYLWSVQLDGEQYLKPISSDLSQVVVDINNYLHGVGYQEFAAYMTYCVTETGQKYLLAGQPVPGGGVGSDIYIFDLAKGIAAFSGEVIKSEAWPYFGCSSILQISSESMYVFCSAGDGGFSAQAIYKKNLTSGEVTPVIKCTDQVGEDLPSSKTTCQ